MVGLTGMDRNIPKRVTPHEWQRVIMSRHGPNDTRISIEIQFPQTNCERLGRRIKLVRIPVTFCSDWPVPLCNDLPVQWLILRIESSH